MRIIAMVRRTPGISMNHAARRLRVYWGTVEFAVRKLEQQGLLRSVKRGRARLLYLSDVPQERALHLAILRTEAALLLARDIAHHPGSSLKEVKARVGFTVGKAYHQVERLVTSGLVEGHPPSRFLRLSPTPELVLLLDMLAREREDLASVRDVERF